MKFSAIAALILCAVFCASADTIRFRGGDVLAAELSLSAPVILNGSKINALQNTSGKYFARVAVKLAPGRKISTEDYSLYCFGTKYNCIAVSTTGTTFDADQWLIDPAKDAVCYLIYVIDGTLISSKDATRIDLKCNAPGKYPDTTLPFVNRGEKEFSASVPAKGIF